MAIGTNIRLYLYQEILATSLTTGLNLESFVYAFENYRWNYCLILCEFMGITFVWTMINACEAARSLLGLVLPVVPNFYVFLILLLQIYLKKVWISDLA